MLRVWGIPVNDHAALRGLVATLLHDGRPHGLQAAQRLARGLERGAGLVPLTPQQRTAVLAALVDCPDTLVELRGRLAEDLAQRNGLE